MPQYYCLTCDTTIKSETCRDCGDVADELCGICAETVENCNCVTEEN